MRPETEALAYWLDSYDFELFCTFTTRKPISLPAARRLAETLAGAIDAGRGNNLMFWAAEDFDLREGFHLHALIKLDKRTCVTPQAIFGWYFKRYGRCQLIPNSDERRLSASIYCSKYVTKTVSDYDIYLPGMSNPPPQKNLYL